MLIHVDDLIMSAFTEFVMDALEQLKAEMKLKSEKLVGEGDSGIYLGRTITRTAQGYKMQADFKLVEASLAEHHLLEARGVDTPAVVEKEEDQVEALYEDMLADYARHTGRLIYVTMDRFDVQFAVEQLARRMRDADCLS